MSANTDLIYDAKRKMLAKYPRFGSEIAKTPIVLTNKVRTGSTDGKKIYINPEHFASVDENHKLYLLSHETCHKKFMHMYRLKDKDGNMRDLELWNIVCDAIVNANLKRDGIKIPDGRICSDTDEEYGDWVLEYNCEELYELKKRQKEEQKNNQNQEQGDGQEQEQDNQQENGQSQQQDNKQDNEQNQEQDNEQGNEQNNENSEQNENQDSDESKRQDDDHSLWEEAFKEQQNSQKKGQSQDKNSQKQEQGQEQEQTGEEQTTDIDFDERGEFEDNRKEKREKFKSRREKTEKDIRNTDKGTIELGNIGKSKEEIDWKLLIRKEIEKSETIWSQRRSIAENNYAYRLEENDIEDDAETEVMIDVSGSVDLELVKSFLRQLKPLLKQSKLRVGCFNERFWGLVDIKNVRDIDNFTIPRGARGDSAWTEDWDLAVRSFTKKREINKIVFTDGYPCPGTMPKEDLKRENIIWLVYGNKDFKPCCGKVINITEKQLEQLHQIDKSSSMEDISR